LSEVKNQIVSLNLDKMPVGDEDLKTISQFANLRKLNLSFTNITGATLNELAKLKELKMLSLSGTKVKLSNLQALLTMPKLTKLFVWNTPLSPDDLKRLQQQFKATDIETGFRGDTVVIKLNPPVIQNEEQVITKPEQLLIKHYVKGTTIHYTTDGSDPDSIHSPVYNDNVMLDKKETIKAKAFKPGWISSDVVEKIFYKAGVVPDSIELISQPDPQYKGQGATTLDDGKLGSLNYRDGMWLAYRVEPMEAFFYFNKESKVSSVTVSSVVDINSYLMPPQEIEVWGGNDKAALHLLKRLQPKQPSKAIPTYLTSYDVTFTPSEIKVLKLVLKPLIKLPAWHKGKGDKGWIFTDEVFLN